MHYCMVLFNFKNWKYFAYIERLMSLNFLITNVQNDFCTSGVLAVDGRNHIVPLIKHIMKRCEKTILTQDWHKKGYSSFQRTQYRQNGSALIEMDMTHGFCDKTTE